MYGIPDTMSQLYQVTQTLIICNDLTIVAIFLDSYVVEQVAMDSNLELICC